jgi:hypothetical protein
MRVRENKAIGTEHVEDTEKRDDRYISSMFRVGGLNSLAEDRGPKT